MLSGYPLLKEKERGRLMSQYLRFRVFRPSVEVGPDTRGQENPVRTSTDESIGIILLFAYGQSSHGLASSIRDTPRDDLSLRKSNANYPTLDKCLFCRHISFLLYKESCYWHKLCWTRACCSMSFLPWNSNVEESVDCKRHLLLCHLCEIPLQVSHTPPLLRQTDRKR